MLRPLRFILDILFPPSPIAVRLRGMDAEDFLAAISPPFFVKRCHVLSRYKEPFVHEAVWQMKFRGDAHATRLLAEGMSRLMEKMLKKPASTTGLAENILLIPVPASKKRIRARGFDQCRRLAQAIVKINPDIRAAFDALQKTKPTPEQKGQNRADRLVNLRDSFEVTSESAHMIQGRHILLIDDVLTTGATLHECERVLIAAGAGKVTCFAAAH
jgi:ComF family protein